MTTINDLAKFFSSMALAPAIKKHKRNSKMALSYLLTTDKPIVCGKCTQLKVAFLEKEMSTLHL